MTLSRLGVLVIAVAFSVTIPAAGRNSSDRVDAGDPETTPIAEQRTVLSTGQLPKVEFFVGYSYANLNLGSQSALFVPAGRGYNGAEIDAKINLRKHTSLLFDAASQWGHSRIPDPLGLTAYMQLYNTQFLAGPEFTLRKHRFNASAHTLFGLTRTTLNKPNGYNCSDYGCSLNYVGIAHRTNLAFGVGGGIERNWKKHFAFRLLQADYIPTRLDGKWESHFRLGTGMIFKF